MNEYTKPQLSDFRDSWACEHVRAEVPTEARLQEWDEMLSEVERAAAEKALDAVKAEIWRERNERGGKYPDYHYGGMMHANTIIGDAIRALGSVPSTGEE